MQTIKFNTGQDIPIVRASIHGPNGFIKVKLVFDTGNGITSIHTPLIEDIGYSAIDGIRELVVRGPVGDKQTGYIVPVKSLSLFGLRFDEVPIGVYDFDNFDRYGIDGLLGFDLIKQMHLQMNGPEGLLNFFSDKDRELLSLAVKAAEKDKARLNAG